MSATTNPVRREDIEEKFRELQGEVDLVGDEVRSYAATAGAIAVVLVVLVAFWVGRRRGKKSRTLVEIRRF